MSMCPCLSLPITVTCMKRWGLRASSLSADTKAGAGQHASINHLNHNVLYMICAPCISSAHTCCKLWKKFKNTNKLYIAAK